MPRLDTDVVDPPAQVARANAGRARRVLRLSIELGILALSALLLPRHLADHQMRGLHHGELAAQERLAREVDRFAREDLGQQKHSTGADLYDAEWALVSCQMTVLGLGQLILRHPQLRARYMPAMESCLDWMTSARALSFGAKKWRQAEESLDRGHAYLGYVNMALGMHRLLEPRSRFAALHERITAGLLRRMQAPAKFYQLETYPGEVYPADLSTVAGSIALYDRATGADHSQLLRHWLAPWEKIAQHESSGLLYQSLHPVSGQQTDKPRASGTAFSIYFLSFADHGLSSKLWQRLKACCWRRPAGFGAFAEYPPGVDGGRGDVDSGPVLFGISPSGSAFAVAGSRVHQDAEIFDALMRSAYLFGAPVAVDDRERFLAGGALGNALLLAMMTALPPDEPPKRRSKL